MTNPMNIVNKCLGRSVMPKFGNIRTDRIGKNKSKTWVADYSNSKVWTEGDGYVEREQYFESYNDAFKKLNGMGYKKIKLNKNNGKIIEIWVWPSEKEDLIELKRL